MNRYGKIINILLINMIFLLPACRRAEINHLIEPEPQKYVVAYQRNVWVLNSILLSAFGLLTLGVIHDLYYKDGHWIPSLIPNHVPVVRK
jgi:hypothetical protein